VQGGRAGSWGGNRGRFKPEAPSGAGARRNVKKKMGEEQEIKSKGTLC